MKFQYVIMLILLPFLSLSQTKIDDSLQQVDTTSTAMDNPFLETLNTWSTAIPNEETVTRINEENEYHEKRMRNNDIKEVLYVIIPLILLAVAIVFIRKILK